MTRIAEQRDIANEVAEAISAPMDQDEVIYYSWTSTTGVHDAPQEALKAELAELEQEQLDERLAGAEHVPVHIPSGAREARKCRRVPSLMNKSFTLVIPIAKQIAVEDDEEAQLKELQAALAM